MPHTTITQLPKSEVKIEFVVTPEEARPYLDEAARDLTNARPLPGFRPGKATYDDVKRAFGEMRIWETALERIVRATYVKTILNENIDTIGSPAISVEQLVPGQDLKFTVIAPVEPQVRTFPDFKRCQVKPRAASITDKHVDDALEEMRALRRQEIRVDRAATLDDLVLIDLEMHKDRVVVEGGTGQDYRVALGEQHYIPGFNQALVGIKVGEERDFRLKFPEEHYQKHLAGQEIDFHVKAKGVFELQKPELNDAFAQGVGIETLPRLRERLAENLTLETEQKHKEALEIELIEKLIDDAAFSDIPELLLNEELRRMLAELRQGVEEQGMNWEDYLTSIKKTADDLKRELLSQAVRRIKTAVLIKAYTKHENIGVDEKELDDEIDRILERLRPDDQATRERVSSADYREYVTNRLRNVKTLEWIKTQCVEK